MIRPELPPGWTDDPPDSSSVGDIHGPVDERGATPGFYYGAPATVRPARSRSRAEAVALAWERHRADPWVEYADSRTAELTTLRRGIESLVAKLDADPLRFSPTDLATDLRGLLTEVSQ